jgi:hypothetical protein
MTKARSNATANAAKGDLTVGNGTNLSGVLGVGSNGDTIVADSSTSTGLRYQATYAAGKNAVINGSMTNWQRGTSFTSTGYTADRWYLTQPGGNTVSRSTDTPSGFTYSLKWDMTGAFPLLSTYVELPAQGVKGQYTGNWTVSFWAKGSASYTLDFEAAFNNGSNRVDRVGIGTNQTISLTTTWTKYTYTFDLTTPTINANNRAIELIFYSTTGTRSMFLTGFQFEQGSVATGFSLAGGTIQGELAACQRYFNANAMDSTTTGEVTLAIGLQPNTTQGCFTYPYPVQMRVKPTITITGLFMGDQAGFGVAATLVLTAAGLQSAKIVASMASNGAQYRPIFLQFPNSFATAFIRFEAEL